jgi:hypothetical protein
LYCKPESGKKWKDVNCGAGQQGKSLYSSFIYKLKPGFGRFFRASPVVLYCKPESRKKWKDMNCGSGQQGKSLYSSFIYKLKPGFGRLFRGACTRFWNVWFWNVWFWNVLFWKHTQVWANKVLMITEL